MLKMYRFIPTVILRKVPRILLTASKSILFSELFEHVNVDCFSVESRNRVCKVDRTTDRVILSPPGVISRKEIIIKITEIKVTIAIQEQSIISNILLRSKISFHVSNHSML